MPRQFSADALVRLLLNVERRVVREALTDERLADHEIWIKKSEILDLIREMHAPEEILISETLKEFALKQWKTALVAVQRARRDWESRGGIISRLMGAAATILEVLFERVIAELEESKDAIGPPPEIPEFSLVDGIPVEVPSEPSGLTAAQRASLEVARGQLGLMPALLTEARRQLQELFFQIDPVLQLLQSGILSELTGIDDARARALREINRIL